ncbi:MAG: hypothetical protein E7490_03115 [Ruminococcaceae bacterium]|nr:hypothetical protein [Oscillospiraceae bacterium]
MTINNVSFSSASFNGLKMEGKPAEIPEEEKIQQEEKTSPLQKLQEKRRADLEYAKMELQNQRENEKNGSTQGAMMRDYGKLLKIAMRIMNGDYVPLSDKKKLAEAMPDLYKQAEMMKRTDNDDPKKYKKEFEDEEEQDVQELVTEGVANQAAEMVDAMTSSSQSSSEE